MAGGATHQAAHQGTPPWPCYIPLAMLHPLSRARPLSRAASPLAVLHPLTTLHSRARGAPTSAWGAACVPLASATAARDTGASTAASRCRAHSSLPLRRDGRASTCTRFATHPLSNYASMCTRYATPLIACHPPTTLLRIFCVYELHLLLSMFTMRLSILTRSPQRCDAPAAPGAYQRI